MGFSFASAESDTIKIGHIAPMTGAIAAYGTAVANGVDLAVSEINAAGGILGKQVEVILKDNQFDVAETVNAFNALLSEDVVAIIGAVASSQNVRDHRPGQRRGRRADHRHLDGRFHHHRRRLRIPRLLQGQLPGQDVRGVCRVAGLDQSGHPVCDRRYVFLRPARRVRSGRPELRH